MQHEENPELSTAQQDVLALVPGDSDWPFIPEEAVSGPHLTIQWNHSQKSVSSLSWTQMPSSLASCCFPHPSSSKLVSLVHALRGFGFQR